MLLVDIVHKSLSGPVTDNRCDESEGFSHQVIGLAAGCRADLEAFFGKVGRSPHLVPECADICGQLV